MSLKVSTGGGWIDFRERRALRAPEPSAPASMPVEAWRYAFELVVYALVAYTERLTHDGAVAVMSELLPEFCASYARALSKGNGKVG